MDDVGDDPRLSQLTAEMAWVRRLARALLRDQDADDLAQDAWLVAAEHPPTDGRPMRPWLARVMVNLGRMRARSRKRREVRETKATELAEPSATPEDLVQRVELQQLVAAEVLALAEPYRSTVLLHFFEGLTSAEIARRLAIPEGTVRRRLKVALDELRARIDAKNRTNGGGLAALAPLAGLHKPALGVIAMKKIVAAVIVIILLIVGGVLWTKRDKHSTATDETVAGTTGSGGATGGAAGTASVPNPADGVPAWLTQQGAKPRRIAGRVTFGGQPMPSVTVELAGLASESGLGIAPRVTTDAKGEFDFGVQRAMEWSVRASAPGKSSARQEVDLRNPRGAPPPDHLELELGACTNALIGTVRDASGGPIAKARIAQLPRESTPVPGGPSVTTDDAGKYELCFEPRWPLWVGVAVSADGYGAITFTTLAPGRTKADFALVPEATIVGRVVRDDTGAAIAQAYVYVAPGPYGIESTPLRGTFTDASGHFQLDGMTAGRHLVLARADGMAESAEGVPAVVGVGQTSVEIEIRLETGSTIRGTVVDHGKPVAGARVAALDGAHKTASAVSQTDGTFVLTGVPRGETKFTALPYDVVSPQTFHVSQAAHDGVTIEVESLGSIVGQVVRNKQPAPGATLVINGPNEYELEPIVADARGHFEAHGLAPGPWTVAASDDKVGAFGGPPPIQLARGQTVEVTIDIVYSASISGRVVDQTGAPVPGVAVMFRATGTDDVGLTMSNEDGTYRAASMTGGTDYRPVVKRTMRSSAELPPATGTEFPLVAVRDGNAEVTGIVLTVRLDHLSIAGKVVDSDGAPVADARVVVELVEGSNDPGRFERGAQDPATTTTVDGQFSIDDLLAGTYSVRARSPAGVEATLTGIRAGRTDVTLVVPAAGGIDVTTAGFKSPPQVTATRAGSAPIAAAQQGAAFALKNLSPGSYTVIARTASEAATATVDVAAGKTSRVTLTSAGSGVIAGHVREFSTGKPVEGMTCRAIPRSGTAFTPFPPGDGARTDAQGAFLIAAAPAGTLTVRCDGLWRNYSDGMRLITLQPAQRADIDVRVVGIKDDPVTLVGGWGADFDDRLLVPRLVRVQPGGPAAVAGLLEGDQVTTIDAASVSELSLRGVWLLIINRSPGAKVKIGVLRTGKTINAELTLGEAPH